MSFLQTIKNLVARSNRTPTDDRVLPSGLEAMVRDREDLARFVMSSRQYSSKGLHHTAFLPNPKNGETSVFRHGEEPRERLKSIGEDCARTSGRTLHGAGVLAASKVRAHGLDVVAHEPPPLHANIVGWPSDANDPKEEKAKQKEIAIVLALEAKLVLF